ncbi:bifunctional protein-disulfide isomerase/oxidoreductase DsbC [Colwellia sp. 12G3]|uniref:bifunctional protein-disulfide isomerase/oxidoreductase DsbC n=1 Tax=Colwellia sp. 12G3 TaxID=2058299 RepID=UPI000C323B33|nr:bifunctional protein-disulfide isomerase/oxidoreductase DsbC [Colwellia sp. 12G3]PKI12665.1 bifunctional protein-disulfide isomerase/oxidoreductase DsbC [Colwellia sp. 12G3]
MYKILFFSAVFATLTLPLLLQGANAAAPANVPASLAKPASDQSVLDVAFLKEKINSALGLTVVKVEKTAVPGIALLVTSQGLFYASYNGEFFIQGKVYSLGTTVTDIGEESLAKVRLAGLKNFEDDMIVYKAENEKYVVSVFTDITCGYCRKMHKQMADYNARGITFRYLAYPRSGIKDRTGNLSQGFKDLRSVWCSDDTAKALTKAKSGTGIADRICDAPIEAQFDFGRQIGVSGTPAIILSNGMMIPGYQPPEQLEELLKNT